MKAPWRDGRGESAGTRLGLLPLDALALAYGTGARLHRLAYERGWRTARRLDCRVVSVGNLTLGGSGKTPAAAWLAARLRARGHRVVLATRGYGRRRPEAVTVVSDGRSILADPARAGDEPLLLAAQAPGVPVLVGRDRGQVGLRAVGGFGAEVLVLDDGFQHHRLARDVELLLVDGGAAFGNRRPFPRGPLREPAAALSRAHAVGIVDGPLAAEDFAWLVQRAPGARRFAARRRPVGLRPLAGRLPGLPDGGLLPVSELHGAEVGLLASLARPEGFERTLEACGARVVARRCFRDHHRYRRRDLRGLSRLAPLWVTTEKDAVKLQSEWLAGADVRVLPIAFDVDDASSLLGWLEAALAGPSDAPVP